MARHIRLRASTALLAASLAAMACDSTPPDPPVINNSPPTAEAGGPYSGIVGQPTVLDGSGSRDGEGAISRYDWTVEDGVPTRLEGVQPEYTCVAEGTFTVTLTVRDSNDAPDSDTGEITCVVQNLLPTAATGGPYVFRVGRVGTLDGSGSSDMDGTVVSWSWTIDDGSPPTLLDGETASYTCASEGTFDVTLTVTDDVGNTSSADTTLECVANVPPIAVTGGPYSVRLGRRAFLDGRDSEDPDGSIVSYRWVVEDGGPTVFNSSTAFYDCTTPAVYDVSLTVTDNEGATGTENTTLSCVANVFPTADPGGPYSAEVGQSVTLDGSGSSDSDGNVVSWAWSVADPGAPTVLNGETVTYACDVGGTFTVTLTVADNEGGTSTASTTVECIPNAPPVANAGGPYSGRVGRDVTFDGRASTDSDGSIVSYQWSVDDGGSPTVLTGPLATYTCDAAGSFPLALTVTDDDGATGTANTSVSCVANVDPVADAGGPYTGTVGVATTLDGSASEDPDGSIASYSWSIADAGDPTFLTGETPSYTCDGTGTFTVTLTVADTDGATDNDGTQIVCTAANQAPTADAGGTYSGTVAGPAVTFDGTGSSDPDGTIDTYEWSVVDGANTVLTGVSPTYECPRAATFTVTLTVTDDDGATDDDTTSLTCSPPNEAPTANPGGPYDTPVNTSVSFDGTGSSDPEDGALTFAWSVADQGAPTELTGATPSYPCGSEADIYPVTLTVTDPGGLTDEASTTVECVAVNSAPTAEANGPYSAPLGETVSLSAAGSTDDGTITAYDWSIADPGGPTELSGASPSYLCEDEGTWLATLTVTDDDGATDQDTADITCTAPANTAPTVAFTQATYSGTEGESVTVTANASDSDAGDFITAIVFDLDDDGSYETAGSTNSGSAQASFSCTTTGIFDIGVRATDDNGADGFDTAQVDCAAAANTAPTISFTASNYPGTVGGDPVTVEAQATDSDPGDIVALIELDLDGDGTYEISEARSSASESLQGQVTCTAEGSISIAARATDGQGESTTTTAQVDCAAAQSTDVSVDFLAADGGSAPRTAPEFSPLSYRVRVENVSEVPAEDVALTVTIDPDATGVTATDLEADGNVWSGTRSSIAPGEAWDVVFSLTVEARNDSPHLSLAEVSAPLDPADEDGNNRSRLRIRIVDEEA